MTNMQRAKFIWNTAGVVTAFAFMLILMATCTGNVSPSKALNALGIQGLTNIELTGYRFFGCDSREYYSTGFKATGVNGKPVTGVVCSGFMKGITIRYD